MKATRKDTMPPLQGILRRMRPLPAGLKPYRQETPARPGQPERLPLAESPRETEERFRTLLELAPDALLVHQAGRLVYVNAAAVSFFGARGPEDLLGRPALELVHPEEHASVQKRARRVLALGGTVERKERRLLRLDGRVVMGETAVRRVHWKGQPAVLVTVRDITARKQVEAALHRSQRLLQDILDGATNLIFVKDREWRFLLVNRAFEAAVGKRREELLGRTDHEVFPQYWADYYAEHDRQAMAAGKPIQIEELSPTMDGNERFFLSNKFPLLDEQGQCYGLCCIAMDITDRKRMEQALQLTKEQLTQANQQLEETVQARTAELSRAVVELQQFSHAIIHDLRAPLRAVHSFVGLMKQGCTECRTPRSLDFMDQVQVAIGRMDDLITDALSYARVVQQKMPLHPVNLNGLIRDLIQSYPHLQPSEAEIRVEEPLPLVQGNTAGLVQCFSNLLSNAVKFVAPGTRPRVRLWSEPHQEYQRIWVEDNGIGIPPEHQPQLFRMFCRLHSERYAGTGIGLAVVRKVVERMGGRVGVESAAGKGSRFWVDLKSPASG